MTQIGKQILGLTALLLMAPTFASGSHREDPVGPLEHEEAEPYITTISLKHLLGELKDWAEEHEVEQKQKIGDQLSSLYNAKPENSNYLFVGGYVGPWYWSTYKKYKSVGRLTRRGPTILTIAEHIDLEGLSDRCQLKLTPNQAKILDKLINKRWRDRKKRWRLRN